jgi:hypothetical protein
MRVDFKIKLMFLNIVGPLIKQGAVIPDERNPLFSYSEIINKFQPRERQIEIIFVLNCQFLTMRIHLE